MEKLLDGLRPVLASASPRRRELLCQIGAQVRIASTKEVDESYPENISPEDVAPYISAKKAHAYASIRNIEFSFIIISEHTTIRIISYKEKQSTMKFRIVLAYSFIIIHLPESHINSTFYSCLNFIS